MTMLTGLGIAGFLSGAAAGPAEAQCYTTSYYAASPVVVMPAPVYVVPAPVVVSSPVVYHRPVRYVTAHVGYSGGYARYHYYRHGYRRHHGHHGRSWGFGFHFGRH